MSPCCRFPYGLLALNMWPLPLPLPPALSPLGAPRLNLDALLSMLRLIFGGPLNPNDAATACFDAQPTKARNKASQSTSFMNCAWSNLAYTAALSRATVACYSDVFSGIRP